MFSCLELHVLGAFGPLTEQLQLFVSVKCEVQEITVTLQ